MKIKKIFQSLFKTIFYKLFKLCYGKIREINNFDKINVKSVVVENIKSDVFPEKKYKIYNIPNGRIYTDTIQNVAIIKNNYLVPNVSFQQIDGELKSSSFNNALNIGTPRLKKNINGTIFSLVQGASGNNYFHFLFDVIARLKLYQQKNSLDEIDYFYVPGTYEWQKKIFKTFKIQINRLIDSQKIRHVKADKIIAVDHPWYFKGTMQNEVFNVPSWIVKWLREKFLNMHVKFNCSDKVFIDRSESKFNHCKLQNNDEIINFLKLKGFESYKVGQLDFFQQIYLFNNAKIIIGPHGAAHTNIVFCKPKTNIIEIIPDTHPSKKCSRLSEILNLNYLRIKTPKLENNNIHGDIKFNIDELKNIIDKII